MKTHSRAEDLREVCRVDFDVDACTDFPREAIECECVKQNESWVIEGCAMVDAVIHVTSDHPIERAMIHERAHLLDLESALRQHLDTIASRNFDSRKSCETFAMVLNDSPHLRIVMNRLRKASNVKFGCDRKVRF